MDVKNGYAAQLWKEFFNHEGVRDSRYSAARWSELR